MRPFLQVFACTRPPSMIGYAALAFPCHSAAATRVCRCRGLRRRMSETRALVCEGVVACACLR